jgi:hypothetical protein
LNEGWLRWGINSRPMIQIYRLCRLSRLSSSFKLWGPSPSAPKILREWARICCQPAIASRFPSISGLRRCSPPPFPYRSWALCATWELIVSSCKIGAWDRGGGEWGIFSSVITFPVWFFRLTALTSRLIRQSLAAVIELVSSAVRFLQFLCLCRQSLCQRIAFWI